MSEPAPKTAKRTGRVKHQQGLAQYIALGPDRSLEKLHRWCTKNAPKAPGVRTLKGWSTKYGWKAKAAAHDAKVAGRLADKVEEAAVEDGWDRVSTLTDFARLSLDKAMEALQGGSLKAETAYELQALLNSAVTALKHIELMTGGPTSRIATLLSKEFAPEWMKNHLKASAPTSPSAAATASDEIDIPGTATQH